MKRSVDGEAAVDDDLDGGSGGDCSTASRDGGARHGNWNQAWKSSCCCQLEMKKHDYGDENLL